MDLRDPAGVFERTYDRDAGGALDYAIVLVATVVALAVAVVLFSLGSSAALGLPGWVDAVAFLAAVGVVWVASLQATAWLLGRR